MLYSSSADGWSALESWCQCKRCGRMEISTNCCTDRGSRYSQCLGIDWRKNKASENLARALGSARGLVWLPGGRPRLDCPPGQTAADSARPSFADPHRQTLPNPCSAVPERSEFPYWAHSRGRTLTSSRETERQVGEFRRLPTL